MNFSAAEIKKKANIYHDGKVTSRSIVTQQGEMKSLGVMLAGTYRFSTEAAEEMEVLQGECRVKFADGQEWIEYDSGQSFSVPANSYFEIEIPQFLDYICHYA